MPLFKHSENLSVPASYSQIGQDHFVVAMTQGAKHGSFLEIGAGRPISGNNTYLLETRYGYRGISVEMVTPDYDKFFTQWYHQIKKIHWPEQDFRLSTLPAWIRNELENECSLEHLAKYHDDGALAQRNDLAAQWKSVRPDCNLVTCDAFDLDYTALPKFFTYLQIDIEPPEDNLAILEIICRQTRFAVITFEHDFYLGTTGSEKALVESRKLLKAQGYVMIADLVENFEDWWVDPVHVPESIYELYLNVNGLVKHPKSVLFK